MTEAITITVVDIQQVISMLAAAAAVFLLRASFSVSKPESLSMPAISAVIFLWAMTSISEDAISLWATRVGLVASVICAVRVAWAMAKASAFHGSVPPLRVSLADWTDLRKSSLWLAVALGLLDHNRVDQDGDAFLAQDGIAEGLGDMLRQLVRIGLLEARYHGAEFRWAIKNRTETRALPE